MTTSPRYMLTIDGDNIADGLQTERQAIRAADERAAEQGVRVVVWDASSGCTDECSQDEDCEHVVHVAVAPPVVATEAHVATISAARMDSAAHEMMERGVRLSHDQADDLGDMGIDWLRTRLGLTITTDDRGVLALPA